MMAMHFEDVDYMDVQWIDAILDGTVRFEIVPLEDGRWSVTTPGALCPLEGPTVFATRVAAETYCAS